MNRIKFSAELIALSREFSYRISNKMEKFYIKYLIHEAGWAECVIGNELKSINVGVSYLHDSLLELAEMAISLKKGFVESKVTFVNEPGCYQLIINAKNKTANYQLREYDHWLRLKKILMLDIK